MSLDGPVCSDCLILEQYCICNVSPETLRLAEEALKRPAVAGFVVDPKLGTSEDPMTIYDAQFYYPADTGAKS
jgi:hypothetical protein